MKNLTNRLNKIERKMGVNSDGPMALMTIIEGGPWHEGCPKQMQAHVRVCRPRTVIVTTCSSACEFAEGCRNV